MKIPAVSPKVVKLFLWSVQIALGGVFLFSGFAKAIDPFGTFYKLTEYLAAFGIDYFQPMMPLVAILLPAVELLLGLNTLLGVHRKTTSLLIFLFMLVMTPFTLYIAVANPVTDCGCFGDLLYLSNTQTFLKNILLLLASILFMMKKSSFYSVYSFKIQWLIEAYTLTFSIGLSFFCWNNLPLIDTLPYKVGKNIKAEMIIPEGAKEDRYETTLIYSKEGKEKEFTVDNYPKEDTTWAFVESKSKLIEKGFTPSISHFDIFTEEGESVTDRLLSDSTYTFFLVIPRVPWANMNNVYAINELYDYCHVNDLPFYMLTSSTPEEINEWQEGTGAEYPIYLSDESTLKSMSRSIPTLYLLHQATILNKWPQNILPSIVDLTEESALETLFTTPEDKTLYKINGVLATLLLPLLLVFISEQAVLRLLRRFRFARSLEDRTETMEFKNPLASTIHHHEASDAGKSGKEKKNDDIG